ncbi:MAG: hypothetical protein EBX52_07785, partial [Proteobacteria bacterium]|nr:hypothetical protein [Pseudomonadota bacterium]
STGNLDDTFTRTSGFNGEVFALKVVGDSIYAGGAFTTYKGEAAQRLAKLDTTSCNLNTAFTQSTGANGTVFALEADGSSLYLGGAFGTYRGQSAARIAKVDLSTGAPIDSFPAAQGFAGYGVYSLFLQNSSLYVGGLFDSYRGTPVQGLAKVNPSDGGLDSGFSKPEGFDGRVQVVTGPATGGSLWVGGSMRSYRGQPAHGLAKVRLSDAVLDTDFTQTTGFDGSVNAVLVSGASIFVGGAFSKYRGTAASGLVKLNASNGSMDSGFQARATGDVNALAVSPTDGALFIGGAFSSMGGASARNLAKVNPDDGNSLSDFSQSSGTDGRVLALLASGSSLYVGGEFTTYRSQDAKFLAKVDASNGNLDTTFTQSTGPNGSVYALMVGDSSLFVGGDFYTYRGQYGNLGVLNLDRSTGNPVSGFTGRANGVVYALSTSGADLLLGGRFTYGNSGLETEVQNGVPVSMSTGVASGF